MDIKSLKRELKRAQKEYKRARDFFVDNSLSSEEIDNAQYDMEMAQEKINKLKEQIKNAK